jgi:hypothetical protein
MNASLPERPSLIQLKNQAKDLLEQLRRGDVSARLADAQHLIARQYGFANWQALHAHLEELTDQRMAQLADTFRTFAAMECRGRSPSYECWANYIAQDEELLRTAAFGRAPIPNLYFAAVHLLVFAEPACDLARHYASVSRTALPPEQGWERFREFCLENRRAIVRLMRSRTTQTNEVRRSAYLAAAFNRVWKQGGEKPLALIEIGTSAGLNLCFDHFAFRVGGEVYGNVDSKLILDIESRGSIAPPMPTRPLPIRQRIGIDLHPITSEDPEGISWLNALIWPEHHDRRAELAAALHVAAEVPLQLIAGDAVSLLEPVLRGILPDCTVCVFQTHSFNQIPKAGREKLIETMTSFAQQRPVFFVSRHDKLTLDRFAAEGHSRTVLAETDAHGRWIEWLDRP